MSVAFRTTLLSLYKKKCSTILENSDHFPLVQFIVCLFIDIRIHLIGQYCDSNILTDDLTDHDRDINNIVMKQVHADDLQDRCPDRKKIADQIDQVLLLISFNDRALIGKKEIG